MIGTFLTGISTLALLLCSGPTLAQDSIDPLSAGRWTSEGAVYRTGNRLEHEGSSSAAWAPYETDSLFLWGVDTCLGFFETRDQSLLSTQPIEFPSKSSIFFRNAEGTAAINLMNWPFDEFGVFHCDWRSHLFPDVLWTVEASQALSEWIEYRLEEDNGWSGDLDPENPRSIVEFRNEEMGATLRFLIFGETVTFDLKADYFGPMVMMR